MTAIAFYNWILSVIGAQRETHHLPVYIRIGEVEYLIERGRARVRVAVSDGGHKRLVIEPRPPRGEG